MDRRKFIMTAGATVATIGIAGCGDSGPGVDTDTPEPEGTSGDKTVSAEEDMFFGIEEGEVTADDNLAIQNSRLVRDENGTVGVIGDVKNTSEDVVFTYLEVNAALYDGKNAELDVFSDNTEGVDTDDLEPGEVWDFGIWFEDANLEGAASYSLSATGETGDAAGTGTQTETSTTTSTQS